MRNLPFEILIADDTPENLKVLSQLLKTEGYSIRIATSGQQTLNTIDKAIPDLLLLDVNMPDIDGFEVCKRIKKNTKTSNIIIMFITAFNDNLHKQLGFKVGAADFITKPFNAEEIILKLKVYHQLKTYANKVKELQINLGKKYGVTSFKD